MGASVAAALIKRPPLIAARLAILVLGEAVTPPILAGTRIIATGTVLLSAKAYTVEPFRKGTR